MSNNNLSDTKPLPNIPQKPPPPPDNYPHRPLDNTQELSRTQIYQRAEPRSQPSGNSPGRNQQGYRPQTGSRPVQRPQGQRPPSYPSQTHRSPPQHSQQTYQRPPSGYLDEQTTPIRRASFQGTAQFDRPAPPPRPPEDTYDYVPEERPKAPKKRRKRRRHKHSCLRKLVVSLLIFGVIIFGLYSAVSLAVIKKFKYEPTGTRILTESMAEPDEKVHNTLVIWTDSKEGERGKADAIMMLSTSRRNDTITISSLIPDTYVSIPEHETDKLRAAYSYGGATMLMDTVVNNFGISVNDYICINFRSLINITDVLGGVKVTLSDADATAINQILSDEINKLMEDAQNADFLPSGGTFILNGKQALAYTKIKAAQTADFLSTNHQREILTLLLERIKKPSPYAIPKLLGKALPELSTNMSVGTLYMKSLQMPYTLIKYDMQTLQMPAEGTYTVQTAPTGQPVLAVNFEKNLDLYETAVREEHGAS